jgi:hypothetical protein
MFPPVVIRRQYGSMVLYQEYDDACMRKIILISIIISAVVMVGVVYIVFFYGDVSAEISDDEERLTVDAPMVDFTIKIDDIDSVAYRTEFNAGSRTNGFGTPVVNSGTFKNSEFGTYTLATLAKVNAFIVLEYNEGSKHLVFNVGSVNETKAFYDRLVDLGVTEST